MMSLLNIAGNDSSVVSKERSFQQVMAEGKKRVCVVQRERELMLICTSDGIWNIPGLQ